jgi:hypothetical protein
MCGGSDDGPRFPELLRDPLIQMVMRSDGVIEQHVITLVDQLRRTLKLAPDRGGQRRPQAPHGTSMAPRGQQV